MAGLKYLFTLGSLFAPLLLLLHWPENVQRVASQEQTVAYFKASCLDFAVSADTLALAIEKVHRNSGQSDSAAVECARSALRQCRLRYKRLSFLLDYFFPQSAWSLNSPARMEVEEPELEFEPPHGLQQAEALLYCHDPVGKKGELVEQSTLIRETAHGLADLVYKFIPADAQVMESLHIELLRVMTLYIEGYDAPLLRSGIAEARESLMAMEQILSFYIFAGDTSAAVLRLSLSAATEYLSHQVSFAEFDRMNFLLRYAAPLEKELEAFIGRSGLQLRPVSSLDQTHGLFEGEIVNHYVNEPTSVIDLGRQLFSDPVLSGNGRRSCATCHQPGKYFTDGMKRHTTIDGSKRLTRNTPTLLYSAYQSAQSWDGRAKTMEEQIRNVMVSPLEMHGDTNIILQQLNRRDVYQAAFNQAYRKKKNIISLDQVTRALAAYVGTLSVGSSSFDRYFEGDSIALSHDQLLGANLFLGKAQCGTCHFLPFFNGSTPPLFNKSEYEVLGVPQDDHRNNFLLDRDNGRFNIFPVTFYRGAFKTPTLRNVSQTAPYMHHGGFSNLTSVMAFYNKGGGRGLGLYVPDQTLDQRPLGLTEAETKAIIAFLNALTDRAGTMTVN
jgi:cytochrome c peroxidase